MYLPEFYRIEDIPTLHALMREHGFAPLITQSEAGPFATHLPFLLEDHGPYGTLTGHVARANPHWRLFENAPESLVIFQGPHAYISPKWYAEQPSVPTWNYAVVHAYGVPRLLDEEGLYRLLQASYRAFEAEWDLPEEFVRRLMRGIVGFSMEITRLEGKFKMGQNKTPVSREGAIQALRDTEDAEACAVAEWMHRLGRPGA